MPCRFPCPLEPLQPRILFSTLIFEGTPAHDSILISVQGGTIRINLNGTDTFWVDNLYDTIDVRGLDGDDNFLVLESGDNDILVRGDHADGSGSGNDVVEIGDGNLDAVGAPVTVIAGGGSDVLHLYDHNNNFSDEFTITSTTAGRIFFGGLTYGDDLESLIVHNSRGSSTIRVLSTSAATTVSIDSGLGTDTMTVDETDAASPVVILPSPGDDLVKVNTDGAGAAAVRFEQTQRLFSLEIGAGGLAGVAQDGARVLTMGQLLIAGGGRFDLADNAAVIDYAGLSPIAQIQADLTNGYNSGGWNGAGIVSSVAAMMPDTAVGLAEASDLFTTFPAAFAGTSVDGTSILLRHTLYGDADLNRMVNLNDFNRLAASFGQSGRRWSHGDFDFNGTVNLNDFNRLAARFGSSIAAASDEDKLFH